MQEETRSSKFILHECFKLSFYISYENILGLLLYKGKLIH